VGVEVLASVVHGPIFVPLQTWSKTWIMRAVSLLISAVDVDRVQSAKYVDHVARATEGAVYVLA